MPISISYYNHCLIKDPLQASSLVHRTVLSSATLSPYSQLHFILSPSRSSLPDVTLETKKPYLLQTVHIFHFVLGIFPEQPPSAFVTCFKNQFGGSETWHLWQSVNTTNSRRKPAFTEFFSVVQEHTCRALLIEGECLQKPLMAISSNTWFKKNAIQVSVSGEWKSLNGGQCSWCLSLQTNSYRNFSVTTKARLIQILSPDSVITGSFRSTRPPGLSIRAISANTSVVCCTVLPGTMPERITSKLDSLWAAAKKERHKMVQFSMHTCTNLCLIISCTFLFNPHACV